MLLLSVPIAIGYSLLRYGPLEADLELTRWALLVPAGLCALIAAMLGGFILGSILGHHGFARVHPAPFGAGLFPAMFLAGRSRSTRLPFPAALQFHPTLQQLGEQLTTLRETAATQRAVEEAISRWLPTLSARVIGPQELATVAHLPPDALSLMSGGECVWTLESPWRRKLLLPMRSLSELCGVLIVAPGDGGALYTADDLSLLETIASLGGVALHNAQALQELERLRRMEVGAARDEKRLALGLLSAEISHEVTYPLNFFRHLLRQSERGRPLGAEDVEIGREELARLERMLASLRRLSLPTLRMEPVPVLPRLRRALDLLRDELHDKRLDTTVELPPDLTLHAEPDAMVQLFANLLRNAAQAAEPGGTLGVRTWEEGDTRVLEVWDSGPGIPEALRDTLFDPWVTTHKEGSGLGLAITQRIVRGFGWSISVHREEGRTCFRIHTPARAGTPPPFEPEKP